jgi:hypothetical protein
MGRPLGFPVSTTCSRTPPPPTIRCFWFISVPPTLILAGSECALACPARIDRESAVLCRRVRVALLFSQRAKHRRSAQLPTKKRPQVENTALELADNVRWTASSVRYQGFSGRTNSRHGSASTREIPSPRPFISALSAPCASGKRVSDGPSGLRPRSILLPTPRSLRGWFRRPESPP